MLLLCCVVLCCVVLLLLCANPLLKLHFLQILITFSLKAISSFHAVDSLYYVLQSLDQSSHHLLFRIAKFTFFITNFHQVFIEIIASPTVFSFQTTGAFLSVAHVLL